MNSVDVKADGRVVIAAVGAGAWGRNIVRTYAQMPSAELAAVCDLDEDLLANVTRQYPGVHVTRDYASILSDPRIQAVSIATPAPTHYNLCKAALLAGKDVYVEKPFVLTTEHALDLLHLAKERNRILMVGHLMEYHPALIKLRETVRSGDLGRVLYLYCQRLNLGTVRSDENAMWSLAPHDISMILFLLGEVPLDVSARGQSCLQRGVEDVVFLSISFGDMATAHVHVSWLDPHKTRKLTVVGSRKMAVFDDLEVNEKLRIYDKGAKVSADYESFAEYQGLRFGDILVPYIKASEPLRVECQHFIDCVRTRQTPVSDGYDGLRVVQVLEAAEKSLKSNGVPIQIDRSKWLQPAAAGAV